MSQPSRRTFLQFAVAAGIGAGLGACSTGSGSTGNNGSSAGPAPWPTFKAAAGPTPDLRSTIEGGGPDAFLRYPDQIVATITEPPGDGSVVEALIPTYSPPPTPVAGNVLWSAINAALDADVRLNLVPVSEYGDRLATVTASNDLPDTMLITDLPRARQFVQAKCADITDFVSGDAILEYPNLAAIPRYAWQAMGRVDGRIYGVPLPRGRQSQTIHVNRSALDAVGAADPWTRDEFAEAMHAVTRDGRYGIGIQSGSNYVMDIWAGGFGAPNRWEIVDGEFVQAEASDAFYEALDFVRGMYADGLFHPGSGSLSQNDLMNEYYAQNVVCVAGNFTNYSTGTYFERVGDRFVTDIAPIFAPDYKNWLGAGLFGYTVFKQADPDRIRMLLRLCDYIAAPYGSAEWELLNHGVEGEHFTRGADGAIAKTPLADTENWNTVPFKYIADSMDIIQVPGNEDATRRAFEYVETVVPSGTVNPAVGLASDTLDRQGAALEQRFTDAVIAIVTGREDISTWADVAEEVRRDGGDAIAAELAESAAEDSTA
ncbi:extracellular solute-binding protein [Jiangella endophytica]|uniref:extracellular solute-binding protein n=1 Tax=Jiangella endophytica TaxID=1623398 RepID=UPI000E34E0A1|nr:extracellular solute-binding protein [Jiangella endophytica]